MSRHTPEPWRYVKDKDGGNTAFLIENADGIMWNIAGTFSTFDDDEANARRIVACVNACAGLSTELLEGKTIDEAANTIVDQRDELENVVRALVAGRDLIDGRLLVDENSPLIDAARAALAKVRS